MDNNTKAILVSQIEPYMERFTNFFKRGHIKFNEVELKHLQGLMKQLNPRYNFNFKINCGSCLRDIATSLSNFYSKERPNVEFPVTSIPYVITQEDIDNNPELRTSDIRIGEQVEEVLIEDQKKVQEPERTEPIKNDLYYESLDKRSKEYREWKQYKASLSTGQE